MWSRGLPLVCMDKCSSTVRPWSSQLAPITYTGPEPSKSTPELEYRTSFTTDCHGRNLESHALFNLREVSLMVSDMYHSDCTEERHRYSDLSHWLCRA